MNLPPDLHPLFWDCRAETVDPEAQAPFVLERVLDYGSLASVRWALQACGAERVKEFVRAAEFLPQELLFQLRQAGDLSVLREAAGTLTVTPDPGEPGAEEEQRAGLTQRDDGRRDVSAGLSGATSGR